MKNPIPFLRTITRLEGTSFLILLLVAMPLKYWAGMPAAVKWVGWAHGILFVTFACSLWHTMRVARWPVGRAAGVMVAALLPFGPFVWDRRMREYEREFVGK